jgi:hypothetical protein
VENGEKKLKSFPHMTLTNILSVEKLWKNHGVFHRVFILSMVFPQHTLGYPHEIHRVFHRNGLVFHKISCSSILEYIFCLYYQKSLRHSLSSSFPNQMQQLSAIAKN